MEPPPLLKRYVRFYWILEHDVTATEPYIQRTMADGCAELIFHYKGRFDEISNSGSGTPSFFSGLHGQSQNFRRFRIQENFGIFGVYLYPFAIPALFSIPASELSDQMPDMQMLLGNEGKYLEERMMLAKDNEARTMIISEFLISRLQQSTGPEPAVFKTIGYLIENRGTSSVTELASYANLSTRQFERKFKAFSGFSPKLFSRITRFQAALAAYSDKDLSLTEIAYACGYYDQSHFIHDFKTFSGQHPGVFFSGKGEGSSFLDV